MHACAWPFIEKSSNYRSKLYYLIIIIRFEVTLWFSNNTIFLPSEYCWQTEGYHAHHIIPEDSVRCSHCTSALFPAGLLQVPFQ
jgi:hypothetical protein